MSERRMLVTGAGGFVGGHLVDLLLERGEKVRAMVHSAEHADALRARGVEVVVADLRDAATLAPAVRDVWGVYHIAALFRLAGLPESVFHDTNAEGTRRLLDAAIAAGVQRFVHCSTVGVLGHVADPPGTEESPYSPGDMYQRSKLEGEKIALAYFREGRIRGVAIRPAMIYGPGDTRNLKMFRMVARGRFFYVGKGVHVHFIDVRDLARGFVLAMEHEERNGEVYIICGERAVPLREMAEKIAELTGARPPWLRLPVKPMQWLGTLCETVCTPLRIQPPIFRRRVDFFTKNRHFDGAKAARDLGFRPAQSFEQELADIVAWYRDHGML